MSLEGNSVWDEVTTWDLVLPPSRPSTDQLRFIRSSIEHIPRDSTVGVLGATPEFRDLLHDQGFVSAVIFDNSEPAFAQMTKLRVSESAEEFVLGDWRETLPRWEGTLAVLLSHLTSGNIPYEDRVSFYASVLGALEPRGLFIDYVLMHKRQELQSIDLAVEPFRTAAFRLSC